MAEAIIVMTILGIIATIMITNLKPSEFRDKGLEVLAKKTLLELDEATQQIMINNTLNGTLDQIYYPGTSEIIDYHATTTDNKRAAIMELYKKYLSISRKPCNNSSCPCNIDTVNYLRSAFYLKSGACMRMHMHLDANYTNAQTCLPGENNPIEKVYLDENMLLYIVADINGNEEPNVLCKDKFRFLINKHGIVYDQ